MGRREFAQTRSSILRSQLSERRKRDEVSKMRPRAAPLQRQPIRQCSCRRQSHKATSLHRSPTPHPISLLNDLTERDVNLPPKPIKCGETLFQSMKAEDSQRTFRETFNDSSAQGGSFLSKSSSAGVHLFSEAHQQFGDSQVSFYLF